MGLMADMAEHVARATWEPRRDEIIAYLRGRGFTYKAAQKAAESYIETQVYVARETAPRDPMLKRQT